MNARKIAEWVIDRMCELRYPDGSVKYERDKSAPLTVWMRTPKTEGAQ